MGSSQVLLVVLSLLRICAGIIIDDRGKPLEIRLDQVTYDAKEKIHRANLGKDETVKMVRHWLNQGYTSLFSAFANKRVHLLTTSEKKLINNCTNNAQHMNENARCVLKVMEITKGRTKRPKKERNFVKYSKKLGSVQPKRLSYRNPVPKQDETIQNRQTEWVGSFGVHRSKRQSKRRNIVQRSSYSLKMRNEHESAFGEVGRRLTTTLRLLKNRKTNYSWQDTLRKLSEKAKEIRMNERFQKSVAKRFRSLDRNTIYEEDEPLDPADDLFPQMDQIKGRKDIKALRSAMDFMKDGVKLGMMLTKQNISGFDKKTLRINSPRFLSIVPEENPENTINILSPSILSLHDEGTDLESLASVPKLMKGFRSEDREQWLNFIVEASGVSGAIEKMDTVKETTTGRQLPRNGEGKPHYVTREEAGRFVGDLESRKIDVHARLKRSYTDEQIKEMNSTGYTTLTKDQIHLIYGPDSPYNNTETYYLFMNLTKEEMEKHIEHNIRMAAEMESFNFREKDLVGSPVVLTPVVGPVGSKIASQPMILSPVLLSPLIEAPAIFGVLVLTPWLFVPVILSPRLMGSLILSPFVLSPVVLSPLMMHPVILSPGVLDPFILSPMAMVPFILSPVVFCPGVLSPLLMTPLILNPGVGSPFILSPMLLSPLIMSPQMLFGSSIVMHSRSLLFVLIPFGLKICSAILSDKKGRPLEIKPEQVVFDEATQVHRARLDKDDAMQLMGHWVNQGYSSLYSAFANKRLHLLTDKEKTMINRCTSNAFGATENARCVVQLMEMTKGRTRKPKKERNFIKYEKRIRGREPKHLKYRTATDATVTTEALQLPRQQDSVPERQNHKRQRLARSQVEWVGSFGIFRAKRSSRRNIVQRSQYNLTTARELETPFGEVGRRLTNTFRILKNKTDDDSWEVTLKKLEQRAKEMKLYDKFRQSIENKLLRRTDNLFDGEDILDPANDLFPELESGMSRKEQKSFREIMDFTRDGVKLGMMMANQSTADFDRKVVRINSPRFLSVVPEEDPDNTVNILSPSILSLHNHGKGMENLTSVPKLMKGFRPQEREEWLNFIVEVSGVADAVQKVDAAKGLLEERHSMRRRLRDDSGKQLYITKENMTRWVGDEETRKAELQGRLQKTYSKQQLRELNTTGYTVLSPDQLHMLYGPHSPYNNSEALNKFMNLSRHDIDELIEQEIRMVAEMESFQVRQPDIVLSPLVFAVVAGPAGSAAVSQPIILSPILLSIAVGAPGVLGPIVLSPLLFVPFILSPRVLGILVLDPFVFCPIVLNPLVLHPIILSPAVFDPFILSPLVLTPFILDPVVFTPGILSPFVLSPIILTPGVGSPFILSPLVLSPIIFSPQVLFAVILTPYLLTPIIHSPFVLSTILLSPGFLS